MKSLSKKEMMALDAEMIKLGIDVPRMMELAGFFVAIAATIIIKNKHKKKILILNGTGNNGGDSLVAARHLLNWGYKVDVAFASNKLKPMASHQWRILKNMEVRAAKNINYKNHSLIIDGLLGYNIEGNPRNSFARMITAANKSKVPILAIDLPSGLDATTGHAYNPCIVATTTIALSAVKQGLLKREAKKYTGKVLVAYMSVPGIINRRFSINKIFSEKKLISRIR